MSIFNLRGIFGKFNKQNDDNDDVIDISPENESETPKGVFGNKKLVNVIVLIIVGIIALIGMGSCGNDGGNATLPTLDDARLSNFDINEYRRMLERDISEALSQMYGAGEVRITISLENSGERVLATDRQANEERNREGEDGAGRDIHRITLDDRIVLHGRNEQIPIVLSESAPRVAGALIVAEGASDERIRRELHIAARAVLGAPAHRIQVVAGEF